MVIHRSYLTLFVVFPIAFSTIFSLVQLSLSLSQLAPLFRGSFCCTCSLGVRALTGSWYSERLRFPAAWWFAPLRNVFFSECDLSVVSVIFFSTFYFNIWNRKRIARTHTHTRAATPILLTLLVHRASTLHWQYILGFFFFSYFPNLFRSRSSLHFVMCTRVTGN